MTNTMTIEGTRFATIEYQTQDVVTFSEGIIGFSDYHDFLLVNTKEDSPFRWLQSLEEPALAFLLAEPAHFVRDYAPEVPNSAIRALDLSEETATLVYTTAAIPAGAPTDLTLNLAAPLIINAETRLGLQVVLDDAAYTMKHRVFDRDTEKNDVAA